MVRRRLADNSCSATRSPLSVAYDTVTRTFVEIRRDVVVDDAIFRLPSAPR